MTLEKLLCQEWANFDGKKRTGLHGYSFHENIDDLNLYAAVAQKESNKTWKMFVSSFPWAKKLRVERGRPYGEPKFCTVPKDISEKVRYLGSAFVCRGQIVDGVFDYPE
jgi:hypothetical protein